MKKLNQQEIQAISGADAWTNALAGSTLGAVTVGGFSLIAAGPLAGIVGFFPVGF